MKLSAEHYSSPWSMGITTHNALSAHIHYMFVSQHPKNACHPWARLSPFDILFSKIMTSHLAADGMK